MTLLFSRRLPGVLPRNALARLLAPTYAAARGVDLEEASERLSRALASPAALEEVHLGISAALRDAQGPRTGEDALIDRLSAAVGARRPRPAEASPAVSAALVRLDLEIGIAPESMRATLADGRGRALLEEGMRALGAHLVKELLRGARGQRKGQGSDA